MQESQLSFSPDSCLPCAKWRRFSYCVHSPEESFYIAPLNVIQEIAFLQGCMCAIQADQSLRRALCLVAKDKKFVTFALNVSTINYCSIHAGAP